MNVNITQWARKLTIILQYFVDKPFKKTLDSRSKFLVWIKMQCTSQHAQNTHTIKSQQYKYNIIQQLPSQGIFKDFTHFQIIAKTAKQ